MGLSPLHRTAPIIFVLLWATGFIGAKLGAPYAEPFTFLSVRFAIVIAIMLAAALAFRATWPTRAAAAHSFVAGALIHGIYLGGVFWAIDRGMSAGVSAIIVGLQPVTTALFAAPLLGERVTARHWLGLAVGFAGVAVVLWPQIRLSGADAAPANLVAVSLGLLAITLGTLYQKRFAAATDLRTGAVWQYTGGFSVVASAALMSETRTIIWSTDLVIALVWLVLVLSIGAVSLLMLLLRRNAVSRIAALFYLVPAVVAVIAWALFGETLTPVQVAGVSLCAFGVFLATRESATNGVHGTGAGDKTDIAPDGLDAQASGNL